MQRVEPVEIIKHEVNIYVMWGKALTFVHSPSAPLFLFIPVKRMGPQWHVQVQRGEVRSLVYIRQQLVHIYVSSLCDVGQGSFKWARGRQIYSDSHSIHFKLSIWLVVFQSPPGAGQLGGVSEEGGTCCPAGRGDRSQRHIQGPRGPGERWALWGGEIYCCGPRGKGDSHAEQVRPGRKLRVNARHIVNLWSVWFGTRVVCRSAAKFSPCGVKSCSVHTLQLCNGSVCDSVCSWCALTMLTEQNAVLHHFGCGITL